jgi:hypothetical protein
MGLDVSHDAWRGAYSAFSRWRNKLAEVSGYTFHAVEHREVVDLDWGAIRELLGPRLDGKWPRLPMRPDGVPDPLIVLLAHSDCGGEIQLDMLVPLVECLIGLVPKLGDEDGGGHIGSYRETTLRFIVGCLRAAAAGEPLRFS